MYVKIPRVMTKRKRQYALEYRKNRTRKKNPSQLGETKRTRGKAETNRRVG